MGADTALWQARKRGAHSILKSRNPPLLERFRLAATLAFDDLVAPPADAGRLRWTPVESAKGRKSLLDALPCHACSNQFRYLRHR
jgi:hypothetical protein